jgi:hypothetical protein
MTSSDDQGADVAVDQGPPAGTGGEVESLLAFLDYLRGGVIKKVRGLSPRQLDHSNLQSGTSLRWLITHLTEVEMGWVHYAFADLPEPRLEDATSADALIRNYRTVAATTDTTARAANTPDQVGVHPFGSSGGPRTLRWTLIHLVEETARHAGHADIIREMVDGSTGR